MTLADLVLRQTHFYNGHAQLEISEMSLSDSRQLLRDLEKVKPRSSFYIRVYADGTMSASIYEADGLGAGKERLWLSIKHLTLGDGE